MDESLTVVDLRENVDLLPQYVELRNLHAHLLLTKPVTLAQTAEWIKVRDKEIRGVARGNMLIGVVIIYFSKGNEVTIFARKGNEGTGAVLLDIAEDMARSAGIPRLVAWVLSDNAIARRVFEKKGYRSEGSAGRAHNGASRDGVAYVKILA